MRRIASDMHELRRALSALRSERAADEETASYEVTKSARRFARRSKAVVDDKLAFSATLMRAGEVDAAHRLLAEAEQDIRSEEAALLERVNEVRAVRTPRREPVRRVHLARTLAVAVVGSCLLAVSAAGASLVGLFAEQGESSSQEVAAPVPADGSAGRRSLAGGKDQRREVQIGGVKVRLSRSELRQYIEIVSGSLDTAELQKFLLVDLHLSPDLVEQVVRNAVAVAKPVADQAASAVDLLPKVRKKKAKKPQRNEREQAQAQPSPQPSPQSSPSPSEDEKKNEDGNPEEDGSDGPLDGLPTPGT